MKISKKYIFPAVLLLVGTFFLFKPPIDPDYCWHYKYGEYFFKNFKLLRENVFSYTYTDYQWVNSYWLFEALLYIFNKYFGHIFITILFSLIVSAVAYVIVKKVSKTNAGFLLGYLLLLAVISGYHITTRPHFYSSIFMLFLFYTLLYKPVYKKYFPLLFLFWANLHAEFVIALFILGLYSLNNFYFAVKESAAKNLKTYATLLFNNFYLLGICFLVTFINPNGINLWLTLVKELTLPVKSYVLEWTVVHATSFDAVMSVGFIYAIYFLGGVTSKYPKNYWYKFLIVFLFVFSIKASYMARVLFIAGTFGLVSGFDGLAKDFEKIISDKNKKLASKVFYSTFSLVALAVLMNFINNVIISSSVQKWSEAGNYPYSAVNYIKTANLQGNMFNNYNWGGYLIRFLPEYKTFIDGRMTSWRENGSYLMDDYSHMVYEPESNMEKFNDYVSKYNIGWVIDSPEVSLVKKLDSTTWEKVYEDEVAVIYKRL